VNRLAAFIIGVAFACALHAKEAPPAAAANPQLEHRVMSLCAELRCLVCQNQTLADSAAPLAVDLREQVRQRMRQGQSDAEVVDFLVQRYGDFVRYRPPVRASTLLLWFGPAVMMLVGIGVLVGRLRAARAAPPRPLSDAERARARTLLREDNA
jgi:cytochrome c-type biogenesis protein CcmH